MASLKKRVARQRDTLMARGFDIHLHAQRLHTRLRSPAVLITAFLAGVLVVRRVLALRKLPKLTARLRRIRDEFFKLDAIVKLIITIASNNTSESKN